MKQTLLLVILDSFVWACWSIAVGYFVHFISRSWLTQEHMGVRADSWHLYDRYFTIKSWKDRMPEAGTFFSNGTSKKNLVGKRGSAVGTLFVEAQRAEVVHYLIMLITPVFFAFNPTWLAVIMAAYAIVANVPCIAIQRYNRSRILRVLASN